MNNYATKPSKKAIAFNTPTPGMRAHLALTYLVVIWITLLVITLFVSQFQERASIQNKKTHLYAQAHLMAKTIQARGGPGIASVSSTGGVPTGGRALVIDHLGRVIEDSAMELAMIGRDLTVVSEISHAINGAQVANTYYLPDKSYVMYLAVPADWAQGTGAIFISQNLRDVQEQHLNLMKVILLGGGLASAATILLAWFLTRWVAGPILELAGIAERMSSGRLDLRAKPSGPSETKILANSFNSMAIGLENMMQTQEEFLIASAHELRSPLATLSVLVESMQVKPPETDELSEFLKDMKEELDRLSETAEGILNLLRLKDLKDENYVNPATELRSIIKAGSNLADNKVKIHLELKNLNDSDTFALSPIALRLIASNLIDNAIKYSRAGSSVNVLCHKLGDSFTLSVQDYGIGIAEEQIPRLFDRFYRVDSARQKSTGGSGLGLAIVKEACDRTGANISVNSKLGCGSTFTVTWTNLVRVARGSSYNEKQTH